MDKPRLLPPVWFLGAIVSMGVLHWAFPVLRADSIAVRALGALLIAAGLALTVWSAGLFRRQDTAIRPFERSRVLVAEGPYRFTRNPMYLGLIGMLVGLAFVLQSLTPLAVPPLFAWLLSTRFVAHEERMLRERFGDAYTAYTQRVRRWL
jgi:protein-S-isoprenylcysteine O-methyltransferase Ste14